MVLFHFSRDIPAVFAGIIMQDAVKKAIQQDPWLTGN